jgi:hypothetical protein
MTTGRGWRLLTQSGSTSRPITARLAGTGCTAAGEVIRVKVQLSAQARRATIVSGGRPSIHKADRG